MLGIILVSVAIGFSAFSTVLFMCVLEISLSYIHIPRYLMLWLNLSTVFPTYRAIPFQFLLIFKIRASVVSSSKFKFVLLPAPPSLGVLLYRQPRSVVKDCPQTARLYEIRQGPGLVQGPTE